MTNKTMRRFFAAIFIITCAGMIFSCSSKKDETKISVYFPNNTWNRFAPMDAVFKVDNLKKKYDVSIELSVFNGFNHAVIPVEIVITSPSGQKNILNKDIVIKDKDDNHIGNVYGDIWTVERVIYTGKEFSEAGEYSIFIQNRTHYYDLPKVKSLSFIVKPSKKKNKR